MNMHMPALTFGSRSGDNSSLSCLAAQQCSLGYDIILAVSDLTVEASVAVIVRRSLHVMCRGVMCDVRVVCSSWYSYSGTCDVQANMCGGGAKSST